MSTSQIKDLNTLHQAFRTRLEGWLAAVKAAGFDLTVYETFRSGERQAYLYAQGRTRPGNIVTYTTDSVHRYSCAADWAPLVGGVLSWDRKVYERIYAAVPPTNFGLEKLDFEMPHLQLIGGQDAAKRLGIVRDTPQHSIWPLPVAVPVKSAKPSKRPLSRVTLVDDAGNDVLLTDARAIYGGVLIENSDTGVRLTKNRSK